MGHCLGALMIAFKSGAAHVAPVSRTKPSESSVDKAD